LCLRLAALVGLVGVHAAPPPREYYRVVTMVLPTATARVRTGETVLSPISPARNAGVLERAP
ncbi:MAG TPA: hypothetical protein H9755_12760, partial [Candidatus Dietzia intestinigallinarum]|nr:hypothetical protein [Candidatus Dietzia intestinigallinarum]